MKRYVKHEETLCFITRWNTEKGVENTTRSGVCLTNFKVFHLVMKTVSNGWYYFSNKMILPGEIKDAVMSSFSSNFQTLIEQFVFSLWIIEKFEISKQIS